MPSKNRALLAVHRNDDADGVLDIQPTTSIANPKPI